MSKQAFKRVRRHLKLAVSREPVPSHADYGCYAVLYQCADGGVLCPACVNKEIRLIDDAIKCGYNKQWEVVGQFVHWEGPPLHCDHCSKELPSEYGIPEGSECHG